MPAASALPGELPSPLVTAVDMGYGHLRAAYALADELGTSVTRADRAPWTGAWELALWAGSRTVYEGLSRASQGRRLAALLRPMLDRLTRIEPLGAGPGHPSPAGPGLHARQLARLVRRGLARSVVEAAREAGAPLVSTFFVPALAADALGYAEAFCVVTDADLSRAWVPAEPRATTVSYLAPSGQAARRLRAYGVPAERVIETGFPLPGELLGGPDLPVLRQALARRLVALDPRGVFLGPRRREIEERLGPLPHRQPGPLAVTCAVGGAGAQSELVRRLLAGLRPALEAGGVSLCLVAGVRGALAARFEGWIRQAGLDGGPVEVLAADSAEDYFRAFNRRLVATDLLWTKPSELTFFGALGLPLLLAPPVGSHETFNRRWAIERGAALAQPWPETAAAWLRSRRDRGELAAAAWAGYRRLPNRGLYRIVDLVTGSPRPPRVRLAPAPSTPKESLP